MGEGVAKLSGNCFHTKSESKRVRIGKLLKSSSFRNQKGDGQEEGKQGVGSKHRRYARSVYLEGGGAGGGGGGMLDPAQWNTR